MRFRRSAASGLVASLHVSLLVMLASLSVAIAADSIGFDGRRYFQKFEDLNNPVDHIAEYVLPRETVDTWTSLVTFHAFPRSPPNAVQAATSLGNTLRSRDSSVEFNLVANPATSEALIDFLIATPGSDVVEFNVFKYAPVGNTGLIAAQFARRFRAGSMSLDQLREMRRRAVAEMSRFDMAAVKTYFARVR
jgi:hypothetical protein